MTWFDGMDLTPWTTDTPAEAMDMGFAQAIARKRAEVRGRRQRVVVTDRHWGGWPILEVVDTYGTHDNELETVGD